MFRFEDNRRGLLCTALAAHVNLVVAAVMYLKWKRRKRRYWVHPSLQYRHQFGTLNMLADELRREDHDYFLEMFRMTPSQFSKLLKLVGPHIKRQNRLRTPVSEGERLAVTLRFLSTGEHQQTIAMSYRFGRSTVCTIIHDTCKAIVKVLMSTYMKPPEKEDWLKIADDFMSTYQFPNCVGAVDGKKVQVQHNLSGVIVASCSSHHRFLTVDVGGYTSNSNTMCFRSSYFGKRLLEGRLNLPEPVCLPDTEIPMPYVFVGDEAFSLTENLMRPYPTKQLNQEKEIFNCQLSRVSQIIDNAFGVLVARWRVFTRPINMELDRANCVILSACCLHNFLCVEEANEPADRKFYCPPGFVDELDSEGGVVDGQWRDIAPGMVSIGRMGSNTYTRSAEDVRRMFTEYFSVVSSTPLEPMST